MQKQDLGKKRALCISKAVIVWTVATVLEAQSVKLVLRNQERVRGPL
jgi:hypothetical protein